MLGEIESYFSITAGCIGLFVVIIMLFSHKTNKAVNIYLFIVLLLTSLRSIDQGFFGQLHSIKSLSWGRPFLLIVVPAVYSYLHSLVQKERLNVLYHVKHLTFPLLLTCLNVLHHLILEKYRHIFSTLVIISVSLFIVYYLIKSVKLLYPSLRHRTLRPHTISDVPWYLRKWGVFFLSVLCLLGIRLLFSMYSEFFSEKRLLGYSFSLLTSVLWIILYIKIIVSPEILHGYIKVHDRMQRLSMVDQSPNSIWITSIGKITNKQDLKLQNLISAKIPDYIQKIETLASNIHPFRSRKYNIKAMSRDLRIPESHIIFTFKYHCTTSFVEFKKYHRIQDALKLIDDHYLDSRTFEALAEKIGFSSYNSFFKSFKTYSGHSPKAYWSAQGEG